MNFYKRLFTKHKFTALFLLVMGIVLVLIPYQIKNEIVSTYKENLKAKANEMSEAEIKQAEEYILRIEKGELSQAGGDYSGDFMYQDYFNQPWRFWVSSYIIWRKARNIFFVLVGLLLFSPLINILIDKMSLLNLKMKGVFKTADES